MVSLPRATGYGPPFQRRSIPLASIPLRDGKRPHSHKPIVWAISIHPLSDMLNIYLDNLPPTVKTLRAGWTSALQSAAVLVRVPLRLFNSVKSEDRLAYGYLVRITRYRGGCTPGLLQERREFQARLNHTRSNTRAYLRSHHC